jgi:hypothetical protein
MLYPESQGFGMVRSSDPPTSEEAAASVDVNEREFDVLLALFNLGRGTNEEICWWLNFEFNREGIPSNISPRIKPLRNKGMVVYVDKKKGSQGVSVSIWSLTTHGTMFVKDRLFERGLLGTNTEDELFKKWGGESLQ